MILLSMDFVHTNVFTLMSYLSCKFKLLILVTTSEQVEALLELSLSICSFFPCYFKTQYNDIFFSSSVSGPFISPVLVFIWCLGELIWLIKPAYHCVFSVFWLFSFAGMVGFFLTNELYWLIASSHNARADSRGGLRREWTGPLFHSSDLLDWLSCTGKFLLLYLSPWMCLLGNLQSWKVGKRIVEEWIPSSFTAVFGELSYRDDNSEEVQVWGKM